MSKSKRKTMKCKIPHSDLILYAENSLQTERREYLESHLAECSECRDFLAFLEESLMVVEEEKVISNNPFLYTRIMARLVSNEEPSLNYINKYIPSFAFSLFLIASILGGINLGRLYSGNTTDYSADLQEEISYVDDLRQESIETFLFTLNDDENE